MLPLMHDYYDSVREEACAAIEFLIHHFMPFKPGFDQGSQDLLQMLRANIQLGWND